MKIELYEELLHKEKKKSVVIGVVGSRRRNSEEDLEILFLCVKRCITKYQHIEIEFVSGGCVEGADMFIKLMAQQLNLKLTEHLPDFKLSNNYFTRVQAYHARNLLIAKDCDFLIAMVSPDRKGGTENTILHAQKLNKKIILI